MKELRKARRAIDGPAAAAVERGQAKRAKMRKCPYCSERFPNAERVQSHLEKSSCLKRAEAKARREEKANAVTERRKGTIDPQRPELGKVGKGTLMHALLMRQQKTNPK